MYLLVVCTYGLVHVLFVIYHMACNWMSSQVVNVLLVGPVQLIPFP